MKIRIVMSALLAFPVAAWSLHAKASVPPLSNCELVAPPAASGEDSIHGNLVKVFPRRSKIDSSYTGCQTVWVNENKYWSVFMVGVFERGELVKMSVPSRPGDSIEKCLRKDGQLIAGDEDVCSAMEAFPYSSAPSGCSVLQSKDKKENPACKFD
ncbi:hypothetical protein GTP58_09265 [Duganella sp. CY15W]|uniref:hypothetical protein n=1 Tax=Duganella sp. CY15W TaxID=2692172 RepID=UPI00136FF5D5|nr:hypothetical protein [Duganella sp. CY15W]MYM28510.1 hypothetical protein [Duganella sp. CY15W]